MQVADGGFGPVWGIHGLRDEPGDGWGGLVTWYSKLKKHHRLVSLTDLKQRATPDCQWKVISHLRSMKVR